MIIALRNSIKKSRGFTLIELLVVISIIGLLASIVLAGLNGARQRAAVISIVSNLKSVEKALYLLAYDEEIDQWWLEGDFTATFTGSPDIPASNPNISELIRDPNRLGRFLSAAPTLPIGRDMGYDNDSDQHICGAGGANIYRGVIIHIRGVPSPIAEQVSAIIDGNADLLCGRIRWHVTDNSLFYSLSDDYRQF